MVHASLRETLSGQLISEKKFAKERDFFNEQNEQLKSENQSLKEKIEKLEFELAREKDYNL